MCGRLTSSTVAPAASSAATASSIRRRDVGLHAGDEVLLRQAEALAAQAGGGLVVAVRQMEQLVGDRDRRRGGVALVAAGDRVEQRRRVADVAGERPDLVERRGERDDPVARHPAVGRLQPDDPGQRRRLADRAAGVGAERERRVVRGDRDRGAAADEPPGTVSRSHGLRHGPVGAVLVRRAHRELVHVRLAEDHRPDGAEPLGDVGVVRREVALEDPRAGRALAALDGDQVLQRDRDARAADGRPASRGAEAGVRGVGLAERPVAIDREPGVQGMVPGLGGVEVGLRQLARRSPRPRAAARPSRGRVSRVRSDGHRAAHSAARIAGTTM